MNTTSAAKPRVRSMEVPQWAVITVIALLIGLVGWSAVKFWKTGTRTGVEFEELASGRGNRQMDPSAAVRRAMAPARNRDDAIWKSRSGNVHVNHGGVEAVVTIPARGEPTVDMLEYATSLRSAWLSKDQYRLHVEAIRIADTPNIARFVGLTPEQKLKLHALTYRLETTPAERIELIKAVKAWDAAAESAKAPAAEALKTLVAKIGAAHLEETRARLVNRAAQIPVILTSEQLQKSREWVAGPTSRPAAIPATRPALIPQTATTAQ